jgi:tetratricopeptide (TPR) repeat protein
LLYHTISLNYWLLGLRHQAETMLESALRADPQLFIGHVFAGLYALADGDTAAAAGHLADARRIRPHDDITRGLSAALLAMDSLHSAPRPAATELAIGRQYVSLGLVELGIDQALKALAFEPENAEALRTLADLYERKHRHAPALAARRRLARLAPTGI